MNAMLPLDRLSKEAELGFEAHGVKTDSIQLALQLDVFLQHGTSLVGLVVNHLSHVGVRENHVFEQVAPQFTVDVDAIGVTVHVVDIVITVENLVQHHFHENHIVLPRDVVLLKIGVESLIVA